MSVRNWLSFSQIKNQSLRFWGYLEKQTFLHSSKYHLFLEIKKEAFFLFLINSCPGIQYLFWTFSILFFSDADNEEPKCFIFTYVQNKSNQWDINKISVSLKFYKEYIVFVRKCSLWGVVCVCVCVRYLMCSLQNQDNMQYYNPKPCKFHRPLAVDLIKNESVCYV